MLNRAVRGMHGSGGMDGGHIVIMRHGIVHARSARIVILVIRDYSATSRNYIIIYS